MKDTSGTFLTDSGITLLQIGYVNQIMHDFEKHMLSPKELRSVLNSVILQNLDTDYIYEVIVSSKAGKEALKYWETHTKEMRLC